MEVLDGTAARMGSGGDGPARNAFAATARLRWLLPAALLVPVFSWWWNYTGGPPTHGSDHPIGIGLFMLPRLDTGWWSPVLVPIYAGCYCLVFAITAAATLWMLRDSDVDDQDLSGPLPAEAPTPVDSLKQQFK